MRHRVLGLSYPTPSSLEQLRMLEVSGFVSPVEFRSGLLVGIAIDVLR